MQYIELKPTPDQLEKLKEFSKLNSVYGIYHLIPMIS